MDSPCPCPLVSTHVHVCASTHTIHTQFKKYTLKARIPALKRVCIQVFKESLNYRRPCLNNINDKAKLASEGFLLDHISIYW